MPCEPNKRFPKQDFVHALCFVVSPFMLTSSMLLSGPGKWSTVCTNASALRTASSFNILLCPTAAHDGSWCCGGLCTDRQEDTCNGSPTLARRTRHVLIVVRWRQDSRIVLLSASIFQRWHPFTLARRTTLPAKFTDIRAQGG